MEEKKKNEEREKIEKSISGSATVKKKNKFEKAMSSFIVEDLKKIGYYVWENVIIPGIKETVENGINDAIHGSFWGGEEIGRGGRTYNGGRSRKRRVDDDYYDYSASSKKKKNSPRRYNDHFQDLDNITLETRSDYEDLRNDMMRYLHRYKSISVLNLWEFLGEEDLKMYATPSDNDYGWYDLSEMNCERLKDGSWLLILPRPEYLE